MTRTTLESFERAGLAALVRAGEAKQWFRGHFGAAMIAGARLLREPDLPGPAGLALSRRLEEMLATGRDGYRALEGSDASPCGVEPLLDRLRADAGVLRGTGHSTIYGATALLVLARDPALATPRVIEGLLGLHEAGRVDDPRRYYGFEDYFDAIRHQGERPGERPGAGAARDTSIDAFRRAVAALGHLVADRDIEGRHYFLTGEKIHLVTHARAIAIFEGLGHLDIAEHALRAQHSLERLVAPSDALEATQIDRVETTPYDVAFWQQESFDAAHVIKLAEAFVVGIARVPEEEGRSMMRAMGSVWPMLGIA